LILVTRPKESAAHTQLMFEMAGFQVFCEPLLRVSFLNPFIHVLEDAHYVTTSAHGVRALASLAQERHMPIWCVGEQSKNLAHSLGFYQVFSPNNGNENAMALLQAIDSQVSKNCPLIYVHGHKISVDLKTPLIQKGYEVVAYECYKTTPVERFSQYCLDLFHANRIQAITLYSEETARVFTNLVKMHSLESSLSSCTALCLSGKIKNSLASYNIRTLVASSTEKLAIAIANAHFS
jgi:uroporphyrinogen-III synthase